MDNASLLFDSLCGFENVKDLIGKQEYLFLDFKESRTSNGAMLDDDKTHFSKAASGFAHQQGGVLVWGVEARKNADGIDEAVGLRPICNIKRFLSELNAYVKYSTEPVVNGIQSRLIYENDDERSNEGYAVTFFPKSESEHMALGNTKHDFYRRHGDSFVWLSTADIRDLFFRNRSPDLELRVVVEATGLLRLSLHNRGRGLAKFSSVQFALSPQVGGQWYDGGGNRDFKTGWLEYDPTKPLHYQFCTNAGVVVHPDQELCILVGPVQMSPQRSRITRVDYRLFAENMVPKESWVEL
jgi:hypothetical protein